jgi:hypothetical protein
MVNATFEQHSQQRRNNYYTLPFISNYIRDENNNVYNTDSRSRVGIWDASQSAIVVEGDYYHGPPVIVSQSSQQLRVDFMPATESRRSNSPLDEFEFFADEPTMAPLSISDLDIVPEDGEIVELFPVEGASQFRQTINGNVYYLEDVSMTHFDDDNSYLIGFAVVKTLMGASRGTAYKRKITKIRLFPQYRHLEALVENRNILVELAEQ